MFTTILNDGVNLINYLICMGVSLLLGLLIAFSCHVKNKCTQTLFITLVLLPAIVQTVIMLVNGNIGTGIAVAGAFSLIRFRSAPGNARDISMIFLAMVVGIATGTGYLFVAVVFAVLLCLIYVLLCYIGIGTRAQEEKDLKITIPENLDYSDVFDDLFEEFTQECKLVEVKTTNMGSMYRLHYCIRLKQDVKEKDLIDRLRCRNGNLEISCGRSITLEQL